MGLVRELGWWHQAGASLREPTAAEWSMEKGRTIGAARRPGSVYLWLVVKLRPYYLQPLP